MRRWLGLAYAKLVGWECVGQKPSFPKYIILGTPHTSNWDFPIMIACGWILGIRIAWLGKHTLFRWPMGGLMRFLGGVPIDRRSSRGTVEEIASAFARSDEMVLLIPPEGTRKLTPYWRSGFYQIARAANIPVVMGFLDFGRKRGGLGPSFIPTGNVKQDMDQLRAFYATIKGKHPEKFGPVRLKSEMEEAEAEATARG